MPTFQFTKLRGLCFCLAWSAGLFSAPVQGQNFEATDHHARNIPRSHTHSIQSLAEQLCSNQSDATHKARAIYTWITANISYHDEMPEGELWATPEHLERQRAEQVLQGRTAVCQGYANLFCALAQEAGLPCEIVTGIIKNEEGQVELVGHAWVAAQVGKEWHLFDPTWGKTDGQVSEKYFMAKPADFIRFHLPDDPVWQLSENPVTERRFRDPKFEITLDHEVWSKSGDFKFRDTLAHWLSLDSVSRQIAAESRILRFNGSNDRVLFGLGQRYWGLFFDLRGLLDSLTTEAILKDSVQLDTLWFDLQFTLLQQYHGRARALFDRLETKERREKAQKFYTPQDVAAMIDKLRGDLRTSTFQYLIHLLQPGTLSEKQLGKLRFQKARAWEEYAKAEKKLDCSKLPNECFEINHNRSLMAIQLAQRQVRFAQELANEETSVSNQKNMAGILNEAQVLYQQAIEDSEQMRRRPPKFAFVDERIITARQGLITLQTCRVRAERIALSPRVEETIKSESLNLNKANALAVQMAQVDQSIENVMAALKSAPREWRGETLEIARYNLYLESYALHSNLANLHLRILHTEYQHAERKNNLAKQRQSLRARSANANQSLKKATEAFDYFETGGRMQKTSLAQKRVQLNNTKKSLVEITKKI